MLPVLQLAVFVVFQWDFQRKFVTFRGSMQSARLVVTGLPLILLLSWGRGLSMCVPNSLAVFDRAASVSPSERSLSSSDGLGGSGSGSTVAGCVATGGVVDAATSDSFSVESSVSCVASGWGCCIRAEIEP